MADLPSILGGMAQGFLDFGKSAVDLFGTGGAAVGDLVDTIRTGKVSTKNQDDFRKWLYNTDSVQDAAAKGLGTALNGVQTVTDYIPGIGAVTKNPLFNAGQGALGGLADEFKTYGKDYDLGRAGERAAVSAGAALASGGLGDALKKSANPLLSSGTVQGLARGATGGAITGGGYAAIDGGDIAQSALQGAGTGALIGGATGAMQDFMPRKATYDMALTDDERQARIANAKNMLANEQDPERIAELNNQINNLGGGLDGAQNYRTFATSDEAREYFSKNNPAYWDGLPSSVDEGIQEYTRNGYSRVNDMLRTGQDNYGYPDTDVLIGDIERGIEGYNLPDDIKVYRRSAADAYKNLGVGDTFTDEGFTSTSISPNIGGDFGKANIEINVGNGKGVGAFIGDLSSGNGDEGEFLLQRGTKYKVLGRSQDGTLQLEVVGNERRPIEQILSASDAAVNDVMESRVAPGQLGLFGDIPTQTPKTGTRQTSLFDQPQEGVSEPVNPYAPVDGKLTQAMKDRYWEVMKNADSFGGAIDNELYNKIDQSTLPKGYDKLRQLLDSQMGEDSKVAVELRKGIGTDIPLRADLDKLVEYVYGDEINGKQTFYKDLDESVRLNRKNAPLIGIDAEQAEADARNSARNKLISRAIEKAERKVIDDVVGSGDSDDILYALQDYRRRGVRTGRAGALDTVLSERLGIAPGNTVKVTNVTDSDRLSSGALGRYARSERNIAVSDMNSPEGKVSTMAHERLHSFQNEARPESAGRYDPEVAEAYKQLQKDLGHYYKSNSEIKKRYKRDVDYWASSGEQESRMFQQYLENKGYTDNSAWRKMGGKADEWGNEINPAFDKFIDKLRDLSKRGIALPALTALFGGGALMANQQKDKEEVK